MIEAVRSSETSVNFYRTTCHDTTEGITPSTFAFILAGFFPSLRFGLKMQVIYSSEMSANFYTAKWLRIQEDSTVVFFLLVTFLSYSSALKMDEKYSSETSANF
jgi:hypothetical protein